MHLLRARAERSKAYLSWTYPKVAYRPAEAQEELFKVLKERLRGIGREAQPAVVVAEAEDTLRGRFSFFELRDMDLGFPPDWHTDPKSGKTSPQVPWSLLDNLDESRTGNKKYVWELNRHLFLTQLSRAYAITGEPRFAEAVRRLMLDWIDKNPVGVGINWVSSLELAYRCLNWLWALSAVRSDSCWSGSDLGKIADSLASQANHVERFLSTYSSPNTHLTGEALALYVIGACVPELKQARHWRRLGWKILVQQISRQIRPDGGYFEQSTWYHRYTAEIYLHFIVLSDRVGDPIPGSDRLRVEALMSTLLSMARPDGTWPLVGDDDGGWILPFGAGEGDRWGAIFHVACAVFPRPDFRWAARDHHGEEWWLGAEAESAIRAIRPEPPRCIDEAHRISGWYAMRSDWGTQANMMLIDAGPHGAMNCGHAHADALAIDVSACGQPMLVDAGTGTYSSNDPDRNRFRSTGMHNAIEIDGVSASEPAGAFQWHSNASAGCRRWVSLPDVVWFQGWQDGYLRLQDPVHHDRHVLFLDRKFWIVIDAMLARHSHDYRMNLHWDPRASVRVTRDGRAVEGEHSGAVLEAIYPFPGGEWSLAAAQHSPSFGRRIPTVQASYACSGAETELVCVMHPRSVGSAPPLVEALGDTNGVALKVAHDDVTDFIFWRATLLSVGTAKGFTSDFLWLWCRSRHEASDDVTITALGGRQFEGPWFSLKAESEMDWVKLERHGSTLHISASSGGYVLVVGSSIEQAIVDGREMPVPHDGLLRIPGAQGGN